MKSFTYKNILVPVDFSPCSENAILYAAEMASLLGAKLYIYHVYHVPLVLDYYPEEVKAVSDSMKAEADEHMEKIKAFIHHKYKNLVTEYRMEMDLLMSGIKNSVEKDKIDLVIMGTKGASGISEFLIGSNTARAIESINVTVLAIPQNAVFKEPQKVLFATDFQFEDIDSIKKMVELVGMFKPRIEIAHISTTPFTYDENIMEWFMEVLEQRVPYPNMNYHNILKIKDNYSVLNDYITDQKIDMVVMSTHNKNFIKKLFTGSLTKKMVYHTEIPLLAFHHEDDNVLTASK
jgi:nucleotide-binding universal stress UspA family protein